MGAGEFHTNSCENYFSVFKRGMKGGCQRCSEKHLHRYLAEFDFRTRTAPPSALTNLPHDCALRRIERKRLT